MGRDEDEYESIKQALFFNHIREVTCKTIEEKKDWPGITEKSAGLNYIRKKHSFGSFGEELTNEEAMLLEDNMASARGEAALLQVDLDRHARNDDDRFARATVSNDAGDARRALILPGHRNSALFKINRDHNHQVTCAHPRIKIRLVYIVCYCRWHRIERSVKIFVVSIDVCFATKDS
jgi:hypothetical protein